MRPCLWKVLRVLYGEFHGLNECRSSSPMEELCLQCPCCSVRTGLQRNLEWMHWTEELGTAFPSTEFKALRTWAVNTVTLPTMPIFFGKGRAEKFSALVQWELLWGMALIPLVFTLFSGRGMLMVLHWREVSDRWWNGKLSLGRAHSKMCCSKLRKVMMTPSQSVKVSSINVTKGNGCYWNASYYDALSARG